MKYLEAAVNAQCASISGMCCRMAAERPNRIKEAITSHTGHRAETATRRALRVSSFSVLYVWFPILIVWSFTTISLNVLSVWIYTVIWLYCAALLLNTLPSGFAHETQIFCQDVKHS